MTLIKSLMYSFQILKKDFTIYILKPLLAYVPIIFFYFIPL